MMRDQSLFASSWGDYELLDSGGGEKLERFGTAVLSRPETQALWEKREKEAWKAAQALYRQEGAHGVWEVKKPLPDAWGMARGEMRLSLRLTKFKHVGAFPEQAPQWDWIAERVAAAIKAGTGAPQVLNLFGYTGAATIAAAHAGAFVTHVDASKQSLDWAHENARLSKLSETRVRWIPEDARAFVKREARRLSADGQAAHTYDGIVLDPPAFGRGAKGEVWKIEEDLPALLLSLRPLLKNARASFFLLNGYAAGYSARSFAQATESAFGNVDGECGELFLRESSSGRVVSSGIYARFVR